MKNILMCMVIAVCMVMPSIVSAEASSTQEEDSGEGHYIEEEIPFVLPRGGFIPILICGNGVAEGGEECDGDDLSNCPPMLNMEPTGCVPPKASEFLEPCTCTYSPIKPKTVPTCGNGVREGSEECDGTEFDTTVPGYKCVELAGESLGCNQECTCVKLGTPVAEPFCGDAIVQQGEQCDPALLPFDPAKCPLSPTGESAIGCSADCQCIYPDVPVLPPQLPTCGNGTIEAGEGCELGVAIDHWPCMEQTVPGFDPSAKPNKPKKPGHPHYQGPDCINCQCDFGPSQPENP